jgi:hypothetical protein
VEEATLRYGRSVGSWLKPGLAPFEGMFLSHFFSFARIIHTKE